MNLKHGLSKFAHYCPGMLHSLAQRCRFGIKPLLLAVLVSCVVFAGLGIEFRAAHLEHRAIDPIERAGGLVQYDVGPLHTRDHKDARTIRDHLRTSFGNWPLGRAKLVMFESSVNAEDVRRLQALAHLQVISFHNSAISKDIMREAESVPHWCGISFYQCRFEESAYEALGNLSQTVSLEIVPPIRQSVPLSFLSHLKQLRSLTINYAILDAADIAVSPLSDSLVDLNLFNSKVTANVDCLADLTSLEKLVLSCEELDIRELEFLSRMNRLRFLGLSSVDYNLELLEILKSVEGLEELTFVHKILDEETLRQLDAELPACEVTQGP